MAKFNFLFRTRPQQASKIDNLLHSTIGSYYYWVGFGIQLHNLIHSKFDIPIEAVDQYVYQVLIQNDIVPQSVTSTISDKFLTFNILVYNFEGQDIVIPINAGI